MGMHAGVGRTGWHIDGSFMAKPFAYSTYHIVSCPSQAGSLPLISPAPFLHADLDILSLTQQSAPRLNSTTASAPLH